MRRARLIVLVIAIYVGSHAVMYILRPDGGLVVSTMAIPFFSVVVGLVIGSVGVFLGSLGSLYTLIRLETDVAEDDRLQVVESISHTVDEVRHNLYLVLTSFALVILVQIFRRIDIPGLTWPLENEVASKPVTSDAITLSAAILCFIAVWDTVSAMFNLHHLFRDIAKRSHRQRSNRP